MGTPRYRPVMAASHFRTVAVNPCLCPLPLAVCLLPNIHPCLLPGCPAPAAGIPPEAAQRAMDLATSCRSMLVVGSSLAVWSAFRLAKAAAEGGARLAILTAGPTRADSMAHLKIEGRAGEVLSRLAAHPSLLVPPVY